MRAAIYIDPARNGIVPDHMPHDFSVAFWRLLDCSVEQLQTLNRADYPFGDYVSVEIYPEQYAFLPSLFLQHVDRMSLVFKPSEKIDLSIIHDVSQRYIVDVTVLWDARYRVAYYNELLLRAIANGAKHISIYGLNDFAIWQNIAVMLQQSGFMFYDRFHAAMSSYQSPYQKHLTQYGDIFSVGGWSRRTDMYGITHVKSARAKTWKMLTDYDAGLECLLFAMADRDGILVHDWVHLVPPEKLGKVCSAGLAVLEDGKLQPTEAGMWHNIALVSQLYD